ncbi:hypothetical protein NADFUDRAFT_39149 [Nadsonia fulvescens var. elongata DSM 6958]|uniref:Uncharacterized protein n=1 Tax=Nadsonia fulvescens var. elongata DSM 6958 TaxID=857566 RepID=A0A1E3PR12_9ASCO|nr:hypothetical protein NADFUDRAFT_39149 [Nadsonia fulvescens var. elongata DSM 6958]
MNFIAAIPTPIEPILDEIETGGFGHLPKWPRSSEKEKSKVSGQKPSSRSLVSGVSFVPQASKKGFTKLDKQVATKLESNLFLARNTPKYKERMGNFGALNQCLSDEEKCSARKGLSTTSSVVKKVDTESMLLKFKQKFGQNNDNINYTGKNKFILSDYENLYSFSSFTPASFSSIRAIDNVDALRNNAVIFNGVGNLSIRSVTGDNSNSPDNQRAIDNISMLPQESLDIPRLNPDDHERALLNSAASDDRTANIIYDDEVPDYRYVYSTNEIASIPDEILFQDIRYSEPSILVQNNDNIQEETLSLDLANNEQNPLEASSSSLIGIDNRRQFPPYYPYEDLSELEPSLSADARTLHFVSEYPVSESDGTQITTSRKPHPRESSLTAFINSSFPMPSPYNSISNTLNTHFSEDLLRFIPPDSVQYSLNSLNDSFRNYYGKDDTFDRPTPMTTASPCIAADMPLFYPQNIEKLSKINTEILVLSHDDLDFKAALDYVPPGSYSSQEKEIVKKTRVNSTKLRESKFAKRLINLFKRVQRDQTE